MRFESVLSQADLIEALTPNRRSDGSSKPAGRNFIRGLAGWILFLLIATLMFLLMNQPRASAPVADEELTHNFWMTVLPPFIPALLFVAFLCYALAEQSPSIPFYAPKLAVASHRAAGRTLAIAMVLAAVAVAVAWILRPGGLDWAPSRSRLIIAGVFPWLLFMAISLGGLGLLMRRRQACLLPENGSAFIPHLTDINADGIAGSSANGDVRRPWSYFVSYVETDNLYLIYTKDLTVMIFPKRVLSERDDVELRSMVMSNVPIGSFRERPSAFPVAPQAAAR